MSSGDAFQRRARRSRVASLVSWASLLTLVAAVAQPVSLAHAGTPQTCKGVAGCKPFAATVGTPDSRKPSGMAPPSVGALANYKRNYVADFNGSSLPRGWSTYSGQPGSDPGTEWQARQVVVSKGVLDLKVSLDRSTNEWITGGASGGPTVTYGAYFVRSRLSAPGPTIVESLWPSEQVWPPEIDFNETYGPVNTSMATVHFTAANKVDYRTVDINMTKWHTWGVIWTPRSITYTVDGRVWGTVGARDEIPDIGMHLAIQQQTWCSQKYACPKAGSSAEIDWVAEYRPDTQSK